MYAIRSYYEWESISAGYTHEPIATGVEKDVLVSLAEKLNTVPDHFAVNPKLQGLLKKRLESVEQDNGIVV